MTEVLNFVPKNDIYHLNYGNYTFVEVLRIPTLLASMTSSESSKFVGSTSGSFIGCILATESCVTDQLDFYFF
jgi:hypothetical protein